MDDESITLTADFEVVVITEGFKSSEGDGRTAADIEREMEAAKAEKDDD